MRLAEDASYCPGRNLAFSWHNRDVDVRTYAADELDVAASLAGLAKSDGLEAALDFAEWERLKPPQPRPRWYAP